MPLRAVVADFSSLATPRIVRRGVVLAVAALVERAMAPLVAWTLVDRGMRDKVLTALLFGAVFTARSLTQRTLAVRTESELLERAASSVLAGDVLRPEVLPDQDLRLEAGQAVYFGSQLIAQTVPNACGDVAACVLLGVALAFMEPTQMVVLGAVVAIAAAGALLVSRRAVARAAERSWKVHDRMYEAFGEVLEGRFEIVASGRRDAFMRELGERTRAWSVAATRVAGATVLSGRLTLVAVVGLVVAVLAVGGSLHGQRVPTLADLALFASVTPAFAGVAQALHSLSREARWVRLLARVVHGAQPARTGSSATPPLPATVAFDEVSFRYDDPDRRKDALSQVSFEWKPKEILALSGANGSGKSTCLRLLLALASPSAGGIRIGNIDLGSLDADTWRQHIAFLPQRPYLPPRGEVRDAVRWPYADASDDQVRRALDRVGLTAALTRGKQDPLTVKVGTLSVGERQRVALARLLCRDVSMFLLDEPDANLDRAGIVLVADLMRELGGHAMVAFAAHTPELLDVAARVVALEGGRIVALPSSYGRLPHTPSVR